MERIGPEIEDLLDDPGLFDVQIPGWTAFAESAMEERPETQGAASFELAFDLHLPAGDHAPHRCFFPCRFGAASPRSISAPIRFARSLPTVTITGLLKPNWGGNRHR
jgi:hypothetical protein